jgi:hypothetical protein
MYRGGSAAASQRRRTERDATGRPMGDMSPAEVRRIRNEQEKSWQARVTLTVRSMERRIDEARQWRLNQMGKRSGRAAILRSIAGGLPTQLSTTWLACLSLGSLSSLSLSSW